MENSVQTWNTVSGTRILFVERRALPTLDLRLTFGAGSSRDGTLPGLARMTSSLLLEGAARGNGGEISRTLEHHGARAYTRCWRDTADLNLRSLSRPSHLEPVISQLGDCIAGATFPAEALERVRRRMLAGLAQEAMAAMEQVETGFTATVFSGHPYATSPGGDPDSVEQITREAVGAFHRRYYTAANATLSIVGDLSRPDAERISEQLVANLPRGEPAPALPMVNRPCAAKTVRIPLEVQQTHVAIGHTTPPQNDDDHFGLYLACHLLGGAGLTSVLARRMRGQRGLSYSSSSKLSAGAAGGRFQLKTHVRSDALPEALIVLRESLQELHDRGPEPDRLALARENLLGRFPLELASNRDLLDIVANIGFFRLSPDYIARFTRRIERIDAADVHAAVQRHLQAERMTTVLVGPASDINAVQ